MKISVIITVYNKAAYIARCINSVINQTYDNVEAIILDDCSTDHSLNICEDLVNQYKGNIEWRIIHSDKNIGVSAIRNIGIDEAKGEYVFYIDGDDEITPDCLRNFADKIECFPGVEMVVGKITSIPRNDYYNTDYFDNLDYIDDNLWVRKHFYGNESRIPVNPVNKLVKRAFLIDNKLYYRPNIYHEDELWMFFVAKKLSKIAFVHDITYIRYYVANSIMTSKSYKGHERSWNVVLNIVCRNFDSPCKLLQINRYFAEYLFRYEELRNMEYTKSLNSLFSTSYLKNGKFKFVFAIFRMNSSNTLVRQFYLDYLLESIQAKRKPSLRSMLKHEIDFIRVKLALGNYF